MPPQFDVVHLGSRTHYEVSRALIEAGVFSRLLTDFYTPDWLAKRASWLPDGVEDRLRRRSCPDLPSRKVSLPGLMPSITSHLSFNRIAQQSYTEGLDRSFGRAAARRTEAAGVGAVVYSYYWLGFAEASRASPTHPRILFMEHPTPSQVALILAENRRSSGSISPLDPEERIGSSAIAEFEGSLAQADGIIVPCSFVRRGLEGVGVSPSRIAVVPFGCDRTGMARMPQRLRRETDDSELLQLLWVGQPLFRKGFVDLVSAYSKLPPRTAALTLVFPTTAAQQLAAEIADIPPSVNIRIRVSPAELSQIYASHDLLVMPSLLEGFGMVYLEALAMGTPVVCTPATGVADLITDGVEGFIVEPSRPDGLAELLIGVAEDRPRLREMREAAASISRRWTWERFRLDLAKAVIKMAG